MHPNQPFCQTVMKINLDYKTDARLLHTSEEYDHSAQALPETRWSLYPIGKGSDITRWSYTKTKPENGKFITCVLDTQPYDEELKTTCIDTKTEYEPLIKRIFPLKRINNYSKIPSAITALINILMHKNNIIVESLSESPDMLSIYQEHGLPKLFKEATEKSNHNNPDTYNDILEELLEESLYGPILTSSSADKYNEEIANAVRNDGAIRSNRKNTEIIEEDMITSIMPDIKNHMKLLIAGDSNIVSSIQALTDNVHELKIYEPEGEKEKASRKLLQQKYSSEYEIHHYQILLSNLILITKNQAEEMQHAKETMILTSERKPLLQLIQHSQKSLSIGEIASIELTGSINTCLSVLCPHKKYAQCQTEEFLPNERALLIHLCEPGDQTLVHLSADNKIIWHRKTALHPAIARRLHFISGMIPLNTPINQELKDKIYESKTILGTVYKSTVPSNEYNRVQIQEFNIEQDNPLELAAVIRKEDKKTYIIYNNQAYHLPERVMCKLTFISSTYISIPILMKDNAQNNYTELIQDLEPIRLRTTKAQVDYVENIYEIGRTHNTTMKTLSDVHRSNITYYREDNIYRMFTTEKIIDISKVRHFCKQNNIPTSPLHYVNIKRHIYEAIVNAGRCGANQFLEIYFSPSMQQRIEQLQFQAELFHSELSKANKYVKTDIDKYIDNKNQYTNNLIEYINIINNNIDIIEEYINSREESIEKLNKYVDSINKNIIAMKKHLENTRHYIDNINELLIITEETNKIDKRINNINKVIKIKEQSIISQRPDWYLSNIIRNIAEWTTSTTQSNTSKDKKDN